MITKEQFAAAVLYCKGLGGLTAAPAPEYLQACYEELKELFGSSEELQRAARGIASNEILFGQYPPLRLWLKYCPKVKELRDKADTERSRWLQAFSEFLQSDYMILPEMAERLEKIGGARGAAVFEKIGMSPQTCWQMTRDIDSEKLKFIKKAADIWDLLTPVGLQALELSADELKLLKNS